MASTSPSVSQLSEAAQSSVRVARQSSDKRNEALVGLLFVAPVMIVAIIFQLFPVVYGFYISLQDQLGVLPDGFVGMANFARAVGSLAYFLPLVVATVLIVYGVRLYQKLLDSEREQPIGARLYLIPGFIVGGATLAFCVAAFRFGIEYSLLPAVVFLVGFLIYLVLNNSIARQIDSPAILNRLMLNSWGIGLFLLGAVALIGFTFSELQNALTPLLDVLPQYVKGDYIFPLAPQFIAFFGSVAALAGIVFINALRERLDPEQEAGRLGLLGILRLIFAVTLILTVIFVMTAQGALNDTVNKFRAIPGADVRARTSEIRDQLSTDQRLAFTSTRQVETAGRMLAWSEVYSMLLGIAFIATAWYLWDGARRRESTPGMLGSLLVAVCLMVGGYFFITELPGALTGGDKAYYDSLIRTVTYAVLTVPIQLALGLALAYLLFHEIRQGKALYRLIFFMPYIAPTVATAAVFAMLFSSSPLGPINQFVMSLGFPAQEWLQTTKGIFEVLAERISPGTVLPNYLIGPSLPLLAAIIYAIWVFSGYNAVIFMAGLGAVPKDIYEAAQVDGAGRWTTFRRIVFPIISPTTYFLTLLAITGTFRAFTHIWVLRSDQRGAIDTAMIYIYENIQYAAPPSKTYAYASALSFLLFGIILILTIVQNRYSRDRVFYG